MAQDYAASVQGVALRVSRLNANGSIATGVSASYVTDAFVRVSFTPEFEEGEELTQLNASGAVCVSVKSADTLKRATLEVAICAPEPELSQLLAGGDVLVSGGEVVGYAAPEQGTDPTPNGVAVEVWSRAIVGGKNASVNPYWHFIFPASFLRMSDDRAIESGILANTFTGYSVGNASFGDGPGAPAWPFISDRSFAYARTATAPTGLKGFQVYP